MDSNVFFFEKEHMSFLLHPNVKKNILSSNLIRNGKVESMFVWPPRQEYKCTTAANTCPMYFHKYLLLRPPQRLCEFFSNVIVIASQRCVCIVAVSSQIVLLFVPDTCMTRSSAEITDHFLLSFLGGFKCINK